MKLKEDILRWQAEIKKLAELNQKTFDSSNQLSEDVKALKTQVSELVKITNEMTDAMLTLLRQQIGD